MMLINICSTIKLFVIANFQIQYACAHRSPVYTHNEKIFITFRLATRGLHITVTHPFFPVRAVYCLFSKVKRFNVTSFFAWQQLKIYTYQYIFLYIYFSFYINVWQPRSAPPFHMLTSVFIYLCLSNTERTMNTELYTDWTMTLFASENT